MDLKEFTKQTLVQIVEGVKEANEELKTSNAYITYEKMNNSSSPSLFAKGLNVIAVDFDVAITATETEGVNGGAGLKVAMLNLGGNSESKTENQTISRIKYTLPLVLSKQ